MVVVVVVAGGICTDVKAGGMHSDSAPWGRHQVAYTSC